MNYIVRSAVAAAASAIVSLGVRAIMKKAQSSGADTANASKSAATAN